jgi:acetyl esterase/lipase
MTNPEISPLFGSYDETFPDVFISSGTRDLLLSQSIQLANILRAAGVSVDLRIWEGLWHVFEWNADLPESKMSIQHIVEFLRSSLNN